jgi:hypothetical protein
VSNVESLAPPERKFKDKEEARVKRFRARLETKGPTSRFSFFNSFLSLASLVQNFRSGGVNPPGADHGANPATHGKYGRNDAYLELRNSRRERRPGRQLFLLSCFPD